MLAHTILGVSFDSNSGDCRFLVLDPHYTGDENRQEIISKVWMITIFYVDTVSFTDRLIFRDGVVGKQ